jgi:hypothetical protein
MSRMNRCGVVNKLCIMALAFYLPCSMLSIVFAAHARFREIKKIECKPLTARGRMASITPWRTNGRNHG